MCILLTVHRRRVLGIAKLVSCVCSQSHGLLPDQPSTTCCLITSLADPPFLLCCCLRICCCPIVDSFLLSGCSGSQEVGAHPSFWPGCELGKTQDDHTQGLPCAAAAFMNISLVHMLCLSSCMSSLSDHELVTLPWLTDRAIVAFAV